MKLHMKIGIIGLRFFSVLLFSFGTILAIILYGGAVWSDFEASLFDASFTAEKSLSSFKCPVMMTTSETVYIKAAFTNPLDRTFRPFIQFHMSEGYVILKSEFKTTLELEPGETQELEWEVTPERAAWGRFVLARVLQFRRYPVPSHGAACGIVVVDFPALTGNQLLALVTLTSIICMGIGGWIWIRNNRPLEGREKTDSADNDSDGNYKCRRNVRELSWMVASRGINPRTPWVVSCHSVI
jgi:hypothetical protein